MDLAGHLYDSFLHGHTADVTLRIVGTWSAIYRLHRVVLIQAGFFRSLFTSEFEEAVNERREIEVVFDDINITRAAFELCIGRLYGGGPPLYIFPEFVPTPSKPLTPAFPFGPPITTTAPDKHQPSPPRFLLSLLATSLYLEIPSIASHALSSILGTIGPYTVIDYLNFARGKPICVDLSDAPAVGLERVADLTNTQSSEPGDLLDDAASVSSWSVRSHARTSLRFYYGAISDKIGEACACWLARWGPDMFAYEEAFASTSPRSTFRKRSDTIPSDHSNQRDAVPVIPLIFTSLRPGEGLSPEWIRALVSSDSFFVSDELARYTFAKRIVELRRKLRKNHMEPIASIKGKGKETQQNDQGELPDEGSEEREWTLLFENGIYYANLTPADLISLSSDISPNTGRLYVPLHVLQAANWEHSRLRHIISAAAAGTEKEKSLGIGITGPELYLSLAQSNALDVQSGRKPYFLVPHDESLRIGDTINTPGSALAEGNIHNNISMDQLFQRSFSLHSRSASGSSPGPSKNNEDLPKISNERTYFGLLPDTLDTLLRHSPPPHDHDDSSQPKVHSAFGPQRTYTNQPPFRFSVEFWDLDMLKEKQRLYSQTVWHAGSLFNIYVQIAKKKETAAATTERSRDRAGRDGANDMQLGIYLHRQSSVESIPARSAPSPIVFPQGIRGINADPPEVVNLREGESVLIGTASLSRRPSSPQGDTGRRDQGSSSNWLRTHVRGPSLPLSLAGGGGGGSSGTAGTSSVPQSPTSRTGTPLSLTLTRSRTPININNSRTARPGTSSSLTPSSSSGSTGALSSSLPNDTLNIHSLSLTPPLPLLSTTESGSNATTQGGEQSSPGPLTILTMSSSPSISPSAPHVIASSSPAQQPYRDPRQVVSVYFSVYCASPTGNGQTRFRSGPDVFKIGQSWGWKSGGLLGSSGTTRGTPGGNRNPQSAGGVKEEGSWGLTGKELSLRATVILGVV